MDYKELELAGIDVTDLLHRLVGSEPLIKLLVQKFLEDPNYELLLEAIASKDIKQAEIASHTLKGVCGNMSLIQLFSLFEEQVKLIRAGQMQEATDMMKDITAAYEKTVTHMRCWLEQ